jgi:hypothetical protein
MLIFGGDGAVTSIFGALVDFKYQADGHAIKLTFTDSASGKSEQSSEPYEILGDKLVANPTDATNRVEMTRVGTAKPGVPPIIGLWTFKHYTGEMATMQYTSGGLAQLNVPMKTSKGRYKLQAQGLTMEFEGQPSSKRKILLSDDHLTFLADKTEQERKFTRVPSP